MGDTPVMQFKSHIDGKNADVTIWPDRIEWAQTSSAAKVWGAATMTAGLSLLKTGLKGKQSTNMIPIRAVQGVSTSKAGMGYTTVEVVTGGDRIGFRVTKGQAEQVRSTIARLML